LVTVSGSNFHAGATVLFGGSTASSVTVSSATQVQAVTPTHIAGRIDVTVRNVDSESSTLSSGFAYDVLLPTVTSVSPNTGSTGGGTTVTITGANFLAGAVVLFGTASAPTVTIDSATQIQAVTPANAAGAVNVVVQNPDGHTATLAGGFDYSTGSGPYLFQDGFESGDFSKWSSAYGHGNNCASPNGSDACGVQVLNQLPHGGGYSARMHYAISAALSGNRDDNVALVKMWANGPSGSPGAPGLTNFHIRGFVRFQNNGGNLSSGVVTQRKLFYLKHSTGGANFDWSVILNTYDYGGNGTGQVAFINAPNCGGVVNVLYPSNTYVKFDTWYSIEMQVKVSDPNTANGILAAWINGVPVAFQPGYDGSTVNAMNMRCAAGDGINILEVGQQADRDGNASMDEYRYWDDIVISNSYIGPK
jgi:hypothetical protein